MSKSGKEKKKVSKILLIIFVLCIIVAAYAGYNLISIGLNYKEAQDEYAELQLYTTQSEVEITVESEEEEVETVTVPIEVDFEALWAVNTDIVGWIYIGAENISYPIVLGEDNNQYLHTTVEGTANYSGSIFMEYQNSGDFLDSNTIIYGHNMKDQSMFGKLKLLYSHEDYLQDDTFWVITPQGANRYKMFSMQYTTYNSDVYTLFSGASELVADYIALRISESLVDFDLKSYNADSKVVTLSTCSSSSGSGRFVVQGILTGTY